jgi:hypothetical protein
MEWLNLNDLMIATGLSWDTAKRIIKSAKYKGIPLQTKFEKSPRGQMQKLVLWKTNNSLIEIVPATPKVLPQAVAVTGGSFLGGVGEVVPVYLQSETATVEVLGGDYSSKIITPAKREVERVPPHFEDEQGVLTLEQEFKNLLDFKCQGKSDAAQKSLRARYWKKFKETGEIPKTLYDKDGRKHSGRKTELPSEIVEEFIGLVMGSADRENKKTFITQPLRKIRSFQTALEWQFKTKISYKSLTNLVAKYDLKKFLLMPDVENGEAEKKQSFWGSVPVGRMMQMDGVTFDYIRILIDGKYREPTCIEIFDVGSRKMLAMDVYPAENNASSVDVFNKLLMNNQFPCNPDHNGIDFRPDNGKSFHNLKRCIMQVNESHAYEGFYFVNDFARPYKPKDKAHLESSHRALHNFELQIIRHFADRVVNTEVKNKGTGGKGASLRYKEITVTDLNITIEELRESGLIQAYIRQHNEKAHQFTAEGRQQRWIPEVQWQKYLKKYDRFAQFTEADFEQNRIQGYTKSFKPSIAAGSNFGQFTYQGQRYKIEAGIEDKFSRTNPTKVAASDIGNGVIALFQDTEDGVLIGKAYALQGSKVSQKHLDKREEKVIKIKQDGAFAAIKKQLEECSVKIDEVGISKMISEGLTVELTTEMLAENNAIRYNTGMSAEMKLRIFSGAFNAKKNAESKAKMGLSVINGGNRG